MKRILHLSLLTIFAALLSSCSTNEDFVVLNRSNSPIEVESKWKGCSDETSGRNYQRVQPAILTIAEFERSPHEWNFLSDQQFRKEECIYRVKVEPKESLRVYGTFNYQGSDQPDSDVHFTIQEIKIMGRSGTLHFEGMQAQKAFVQYKNGEYVIEYR